METNLKVLPGFSFWSPLFISMLYLASKSKSRTEQRDIIVSDWNIKLIGVENERRREVKVTGLA